MASRRSAWRLATCTQWHLIRHLLEYGLLQDRAGRIRRICLDYPFACLVMYGRVTLPAPPLQNPRSHTALPRDEAFSYAVSTSLIVPAAIKCLHVIPTQTWRQFPP